MKNLKKKREKLFLYILNLVFIGIILTYMYSSNKLRIQNERITFLSDHKIENYQKAFLNELNLNSTLYSINLSLNNLISANNASYPLLVYVYSGTECEKCIINEIEKIKNEIGLQNLKNALILPVFNKTKNAKIKLRSELQGLNFMHLSNSEIFLPEINGQKVRYFAVFQKKGRIVNLFTPDNNNPEKTDLFLNYAMEKYFK